MNFMTTLATRCPACGDLLQVARLACTSCSTQIEGAFELPPILQLAPDELEFVESFVLCSGSLKEMARLRAQSYPTIRNRLDAIIQKMSVSARVSRRAEEQGRHEILDAVAKGTLSVKEAARRLKKAETESEK